MSYCPFNLQGKRILITGASSGIGKSICVESSKMGAVVYATARNEHRLLETLNSLEGEGHEYYIADLTIAEDIEKLVDKLPKLDGVVLCAGIGETILLQYASRKKINGMFETNFFAQIELLRLLQKKKLLNRESSIIAISSVGGNFAFNLGNGPYGTTKAALSSWMKFAAQEFAPKKIRVNCICPGMIHTPLADEAKAISREDLDKYTETIPLKRYGYPEEVAWASIYLLSDASKYVTGTDLIIDGGTTI